MRLGLALLSMPLSVLSSASPFSTCEPGVRVTNLVSVTLLAGTLGTQALDMPFTKFYATRFLDATVRETAEVELRSEMSNAVINGRLDIMRLGPVVPPLALCIGR